MNDDTQICIGLMSGTSSDAIDAVLVEIADQGRKVHVIATHSEPIEPTLQEKIRTVSSGEDDRIDTVHALDTALAEQFANAANQVAEKTTRREGIAVIGSHGQTVRHRPEGPFPFSLQLGSGALIAARTGITTVADFRSGDIAVGGQGAPLVPAFHEAMFRSPTVDRAIVNIGGIANLTVLPNPGTVFGFDTGPGNTLLDHWYRCHHSDAFDQNSEWAIGGHRIASLLNTLLEHPYFGAIPPKSCGLEQFHLTWLGTHLRGEEKPQDVQATLLDLTVETIISAIHQQADKTTALYLCGGGANNPTIVQAISRRLDPITVETTSVLGIDPEWVEAVAFAWMAWARLKGKTTNLPEVTGARRRLSLGAIYAP
jgi:anhydro-N-acetylmuramic acid kinase